MAEERPERPSSPARGARVRRTGIALVHEGELVLPADGSEAQMEATEDGRAVVEYHFPVEIEIRKVVEQLDPEAIIRETLARLARGVESA